MKNIMLMMGLFLTANPANAEKVYQCKALGGPAKNALVLIGSSPNGLLEIKVKLLHGSIPNEDFEGLFKTDRVWSGGVIVAKGKFKGKMTGASIQAVVQGSIKSDPTTGSTYLSVGASGDRRIEWGYGLHLDCTPMIKQNQ